MKFTVDALNFVNITKKVIKGFLPKDEHSQILFTIKTKNETNFLEIQSTSQTTLFKGNIPIQTLDESDYTQKEWAVDGNQLKAILSVLPTNSGELAFHINEQKRQFILNVTGNTLRLPVYDTIKTIQEEKIQVISTVDAQDFIKHISSLSKLLESDALSQDSSSSCLHIAFEEDVIKMMGTSTIALVETQQKHHKRGELPTTPILIRGQQISLLNQSFNANTLVDIVATEHKFGYVDDNQVLCLVAQSNLPAISYEHLKNQVSYEQSVTIDSMSFKYVIDALNKLSANSENLEFTLADNHMSGKNLNGDVMNILTEDINSENTTLSFVKNSLTIILGLLTSKVRLSWKKDAVNRFVKFTLLDNTNTEVDDTFIMVITNNVD